MKKVLEIENIGDIGGMNINEEKVMIISDVLGRIVSY